MDCLKRALRPSGRICDCGVLWKAGGRIAAIELKGGQKSVPVERLVQQLQGGLNILEGILDGQPVSEVLPVLLYSGRRDPAPFLTKSRVRFRGQPRRIIVRPCGAKLADMLPKPNPPAISQGGRGRGRR